MAAEMDYRNFLSMILKKKYSLHGAGDFRLHPGHRHLLSVAGGIRSVIDGLYREERHQRSG